MDFFAQQARVRASSRRLVALFVLAVAAIVVLIDVVVLVTLGYRHGDPQVSSHVPLLAVTTLAVLAGIGLSSLYRMASLSSGGQAVAEGMGAVPVPPDTSDPRLRQLRNVIEEVAIASGVPVPAIYLMADEPGINAFAAGFSPTDAAVCVTQGCLDQLDRDELQGVIAHEFSHVLNGDMRLNIRLMGLLFGILVLSIIGRQVLWSSGGRSRRDGNQTMWIGLALVVVGYVGYFFGRLIQSAVARERESLADASAVQFTRQTRGIAGALKKIAVLSDGSTLSAANRHEVAHMLFGEADAGFNALFATHPPLLKRIRELEPGFRESELDDLAARLAGGAAQNESLDDNTASPLTSASSSSAPPPLPMQGAGIVAAMGAATMATAAATATAGASLASTLGARVGQPGTDDVRRAGELHRQLPEALRQAARDAGGVLPLTLALAIGSDEQVRTRQAGLIETVFGPRIVPPVLAFAAMLASLDPGLRMPLLAIAFPALRLLPSERKAALMRTLDELARADGQVGVDDYCLLRLLRLQLGEAMQPRQVTLPGTVRLSACRASYALVCAVVARFGSDGDDSTRRAWLAAMQEALPGDSTPWQAPPSEWHAPFEQALGVLDGLSPPSKELVVRGLARAIEADGQVGVAEGELLRVICASLHCPLPPLVSLPDAGDGDG